MVDENIKVNFGHDYALEYSKYGEKIVEESQKILKKSGITVPIGKAEKEDEAPIIGAELEHIAEDNSRIEDEQKNETVQNAQETEMSNNRNSCDNKKENNGITDSTSVVNNTFNGMIAVENSMSSMDQSVIPQGGYAQASMLLDAMEDIDDAGKRHIEQLTEPLPESGRVTGKVYTVYEKSNSSENVNFQANVVNTWQNKNKTFGIVAGASYSFTETKTISSGQIYDFLQKGQVNIDAKSGTGVVEKTSGRVQKNDDEPSDIEKNRSGNISINARLEKGKNIYGAGFSSNFYENDSQIHDIYITALNKPTGISGDLMRRMVVSKDDEGNRIVRSKMNLKIDLLSNKAEEDFPSEETSGNVSDDDTPDEDFQKNRSNLLGQGEELDEKAREEEDKFISVRKKDGSGLDVDFEYDDSKCGVIAQYGIHLVNNAQRKAKLTISPVLGAYDYTPVDDADNESAKITLGTILELKKQWADGQTLSANVCAAKSRVVEKGNSPQDTNYVVFTGVYNNPKIRFKANVDAGFIGTQAIKVSYIEANASYKTNRFNWGVQAGVSRLKGLGITNKSYLVALKCSYDIPYKTKK